MAIEATGGSLEVRWQHAFAEVHGPAAGDRLLVEGTTHEGQFLITLLDLRTVEGTD